MNEERFKAEVRLEGLYLVSEALLLNSKDLSELKQELGPKLLKPEQIAPPPGLATGWPKLDRFLLWQGFPKGHVSLLISEAAGGATSLWAQTAARVTQDGRWAAWVNDHESSLTPWSLRRAQADLSKILVVAPPQDERQLLWVLQELMAQCLFEIVGCDLGEVRLRDHHILKLKRLAARYQTALVLQTRRFARASSFYSLVLCFQKERVVVQRALQRSTPHDLGRGKLYADTLPLLAAGRRALGG